MRVGKLYMRAVSMRRNQWPLWTHELPKSIFSLPCSGKCGKLTAAWNALYCSLQPWSSWNLHYQGFSTTQRKLLHPMPSSLCTKQVLGDHPGGFKVLYRRFASNLENGCHNTSFLGLVHEKVIYVRQPMPLFNFLTFGCLCFQVWHLWWDILSGCDHISF